MKNGLDFVKVRILPIVLSIILVFSFAAIGVTRPYEYVLKNSYDMSNVSFDSQTYVYDGQEHKLEIVGELPQGVTVEYENNTLTNVGSVKAKAIFNGDKRHKTPETMEATLTITKAKYDMSGITFNDLTVPYDGQEHTLEITGTLPEGVSVSYTQNKLKDVGSIEVTATFTGNENYEKIKTLTAILTITDNVYDIDDITFSDLTVPYDGQEHTLEINGELPQDIRVEYSLNKLTNAGELDVEAKLIDKYDKVVKIFNATLTVEKVDYDMTGVAFDDLTVPYDGQEHVLEISGTLPEGVSVAYTANKLINVGTLEVTATFTGDSNHNEIPSITKTLKVEKIDYDMTGVTFNDLTVPYDGQEHTLEITGTLPEGVSVAYTANKLINAGTLEVTATFTGDSNHNEIPSITKTLKVEKIDYDMTGVTFNDLTVPYDGQEHVLEISGTLPEGVFVTYTQNKLTNVGILEVTATFTGDSNHNEIEVKKAYLNVTKATYDMTGITFEDLTVPYDGQEHVLEISGTLPEGVSVSYTLNKLTPIGTLEVTATFIGNDNFENIASMKATLTIVKASYDMTGIAFEDLTIPYDGQEHALEITGSLPAGVTVSYTENTLINVGRIKVTASFTGDNNHELIPSMEATLTIEKGTFDISQISFEDKSVPYDGQEHSIVISGELPEGITVSYLNNKLTDFGTIIATASFIVSYNYNPIADLTANLTIEDAGVYHKVSFIYDESKSVSFAVEHGNTISNLPELPTVIGYDVSWDYDGSAVNANSSYTLVKTIKIYTINYSLDSGTNNSNNPSSFTVEDTVNLYDASKTGYHFDGWFSSDKFDTLVTSIPKGSIGNRSLYAKFSPNEYTITYITNGGTISSEKQTVVFNASFELYSIEKDGYDFVKYTYNGDTFESGIYSIPSDIEIEAIFEPKTYSLKYFVGQDLILQEEYKYDDTFTSKTSMPTEYTSLGYSLNCWKDQNNNSYSLGDEFTYDDTSDLVLNAVLTYSGSDFSVETRNELAIIKGYVGTTNKVIIPDYIQIADSKYIVSCIDDGAFENNTSIYSLCIPNTILSIASTAFRGCIKLLEILDLTDLEIDNSTANGYVGHYAKNIYNNAKGFSKISYDGDYIFYTDSTKYLIGYSGSTQDLVLPSSTSKYVVYNYAFDGLDYITSINTNNSTKQILGNAFSGCTSLTSVYFDSSLKSIVKNAFNNCTALENVYYNNTISEWCNIKFDDYTANPMSVANKFYLKNNEGYDLVSEITISNSVYTIGNYQFYGFEGITSITLPSSIRQIGTQAFYNCSSLNNVYYNASGEDWCDVVLKSASSNPMYYAHHFYTLASTGYEELTALSFEPSVTRIDSNQFYGFEYLETVNALGVISIGDSAFAKCERITAVNLSNEITTIGANSFADCKLLQSIDLGDNVTSIGMKAFQGCTSLESISISNGVEVVNDNTFYNCTNLSTVLLGSGIKSIGANAFYNCSSIISISLPDVLETIGADAFNGCSSLTTVTMCDNVVSIGQRAFMSCKSLLDINISANVLEISDMTFGYCNSLQTAYLPSVQAIGTNAFNACEKLQTVTVSNDLSQIGVGAFSNCKSLIDISIPNNVTRIETNTFYNCTSLKTVDGMESIEIINSNAFSGCQSLQTITISQTVTEIADTAFKDCYHLVEVYNLSELDIQKGASTNGCVGLYAISVFDDLSIPSKIDSSTDFDFYVDDKIYLLANKSSNSRVILPDNYNGLDYEIYQYAFYNQNQIEYIAISSGVTSIGNSAFKNCYNLIEVCNLSALEVVAGKDTNGCVALYALVVTDTLSSSSEITTIDDFVFYDNGGTPTLIKYVGSDTSVILPQNYEGNDYNIRSYAFEGSNMENLYVSNHVLLIGTNAFNNCNSLVNVYYDGSISDWLTIKFDSITSNPMYYANDFYIKESSGYIKVTSLTVDSSISIINKFQFMGFKELENVVIEEGVTTIDASAFANCNNLIEITLPVSLQTLGSSAFMGCESIEKVFYNGTINEWNDISITDLYSTPMLNGAHFYEYTTEYQEVLNIDVPTCISIGTYQYYGFKYVTSITISDGTVLIGTGAFAGCSSVTNICIVDSVRIIERDAFKYCRGLEHIVLGSSVNTIESDAFRYCSQLKEVYYKGTSETEWNSISIGSNNIYLKDATRYYYSTESSLEGQFWHYNELGEIEKWVA